MKKNLNSARLIRAFAVLIFLGLAQQCFGGMAVSPLQQWIDVKPGKDSSFSVTVTNTKRADDTPACTINVSIIDFSVSPLGVLLFGPEYKHDRSAVLWISCETGNFVLQPGESKEFKATVSAPLNADGDYWAAFMIGLAGAPQDQKGVKVNLRTASGVFVHVARRTYIEWGTIIDANVVMPQFAEEPADGNAVGKADNKNSLKINAEMKNIGPVAILAKAKALIYTEKNRRIASVSLHSIRRQVLPGHTRLFSGVMAQPIPAGKYKMRLVFDSNSQRSQKTTKEIEFSVSDEISNQWAETFKGDVQKTLELKPVEIRQTLNAGRFTVVKCLIANKGLGTISIGSTLSGDGLKKDWFELKSADFTLAPAMQQNLICYIKVPGNAKPGSYSGVIKIKAERSGLIAKGKEDNFELYEIPVNITVTK